MKLAAAFTVAALTMLAWLICALAVERSREVRPALVHHADFPVCVRVDPGPLIKPKKPVLYPRHSEVT